MEQGEKLCDDVVAVRQNTYLGHRVSANGRCEAAVTARTSSGLDKFREFGEMLYGRKFPLGLKGTIFMCYVRLVVLYGREAWCLKESEMGILCRTERPIVRAMCGVQLKDKKDLQI